MGLEKRLGILRRAKGFPRRPAPSPAMLATHAFEKMQARFGAEEFDPPHQMAEDRLLRGHLSPPFLHVYIGIAARGLSGTG